MYCILGVDSLRPNSTSDQSFSSERVDYSGTSSDDGGSDGGASSDMDAYEENYFPLPPTQISIVTYALKNWR